ncbi:MAG: DUF2314 domain-containing protein [Planctomycetota bacterium]
MPSITFSAPARVLTGDPRQNAAVSDTNCLRRLHGIHSGDELCVDYIDQEFVQRLGLDNGRVRFVFDEQSCSLRVTTTYDISGIPAREDLERLRLETINQWNGGAGVAVFSFMEEEAPAVMIVLAMIDHDPGTNDFPEFCVDPTQLPETKLEVRFSESGTSADPLLKDLRHAAKAGNIDALAELGQMLANGVLTKGREKEGIKLLVKAADAKNDRGLVYLGHQFLTGEVVGCDPVKGEALIQRAIDQGSVMAMVFLGDACKEGRGVAKQPQRAIALLTAASRGGNPVALAELGDCYEFGLGVPVNLPEALKCYEAALDAGFDPVEPARDRVKAQIKRPAGGFLGGIFRSVTSLFGMGEIDSAVEDGTLRMVESDDPEMKEAVARAQSTLDQFAVELQNLSPGHSAALKVKFEEGRNVEYMWLTDVRFQDGYFYGEVNNDPQFVKNVNFGDTRKAHPNEVNDWMISDPSGGFRGGFTVEVVMRRGK